MSQDHITTPRVLRHHHWAMRSIEANTTTDLPMIERVANVGRAVLQQLTAAYDSFNHPKGSLGAGLGTSLEARKQAEARRDQF